MAAHGVGSGAVGVVSGILNATTGLSGPPVAVFLANQGWERREFRAALNLFFLVADLFTVGVIWWLGAIGPSVPLLIMRALPFMLVGYAVGALLWSALSDSQLRLSVAALVVAGDCFAIASLVV